MLLKNALLTVACLLIASPVLAQTIAPGDVPPINLAANNQRGGVTGVLPAANGGSGSGTSLTNGQLLIGATGLAPNPHTLTAGSNISVTNGSGSISIAATGVATSGANSNITSLTGLTTPLSAAQGGTGTAKLSSGTATFMSAGSVAVADGTIDSSSIVVVTEVGSSPTDTYSIVLTPSTGFTIYSSNVSSTAVVNYIRLK